LQGEEFFERSLMISEGSLSPTIKWKNLARQEFLIPLISQQKFIVSLIRVIDDTISKTQHLIEKYSIYLNSKSHELLTRGINHSRFKKVEWNYGKKIEIPNEWELKQLSELGQIVGGGTPKTNNPEFWNGKILWAIPTDITELTSIYIEKTSRNISELGLKKSSATLLPKDTILITTRATVGECAICTRPMATNQGFQSLVVKRNNNLFLLYAIRFHKNQLLRLAQGTTYDEVSHNSVKKISIPIPKKISEQKNISQIISGIESRETELRNYLSKLKTMRKSILQSKLQPPKIMEENPIVQ